MTRAEFGIALKLVFAYVRQRPGRVLLTSLSTIAAACVVVWVVSGYDSLVGQFGSMGSEYVGRYEMLLVPVRGEGAGDAPSGPGPGGPGRRPSFQVSNELLESIRSDPQVALVDPIFETEMKGGRVGETPAPKGGRGRPPAETGDAPPPPKKSQSGPIIMGGVGSLRTQNHTPTVVGTDSTEPLRTVLKGNWFDPKNAEAREGAITREAAEFLGVQPGDEVVITGAGKDEKEARVRITAIVEQPKRLPGPKFMVGLPPTRSGALPGGPATNALYVPMALAEKLSGAKAKITYAGVVLKPGAKADDFIMRWTGPCGSATPSVEIRSPEKVDSEVDNSTTFETVRAQAYSATGISLLAALFIIFTTLSMGVDERIRQFAMLRAISFTKWQIATMVAMESILLGLVGWGGGLLAGWGLLKLMMKVRPESLSEGAALGTWCVVLSGVCALGGSLAASIMPAWRATSVSPLEAMVPRRSIYSGRLPWTMTIVGLLLIAVDPLVVFYIPMPDKSRYMMSAALGCTTMIIGFIMLAPLAVILTERMLGPVVAFLLRLNSRLLATQLSSNMWRTVGTTVAMTIGLGLFVAMQTWGYSMLAPFTPGDWAPDMVVSIGTGIPDSEIEAVRSVPGIAHDKFLPLAVKHVKFKDDVTGFKVRPSATRQDSCVMIGVDPDPAFGGDSPVFKFQFVEGNRADAIAKLKQGRYCLVPDHFAREANLTVGQKFAVIPPDHPDESIEYEIAGVVSMPGWHWLTKSGFRRGRAAGLMFTSFDQTRADFNTGRTTLFWGNMDGSATEEQIKAAIQPIGDRNLEAGSGRGRAAVRREAERAGKAEQIRRAAQPQRSERRASP